MKEVVDAFVPSTSARSLDSLVTGRTESEPSSSSTMRRSHGPALRAAGVEGSGPSRPGRRTRPGQQRGNYAPAGGVRRTTPVLGAVQDGPARGADGGWLVPAPVAAPRLWPCGSGVRVPSVTPSEQGFCRRRWPRQRDLAHLCRQSARPRAEPAHTVTAGGADTDNAQSLAARAGNASRAARWVWSPRCRTVYGLRRGRPTAGGTEVHVLRSGHAESACAAAAILPWPAAVNSPTMPTNLGCWSPETRKVHR